MEGLLPRLPVFPWLKLGLSHLVLLPFLLRFGPGPAAMLLLGRNLLLLLFAGGVLTTFLIGTASGVVSLLAAGWLMRMAVTKRILGMAGAGMVMAAAMNLSQLALVEGIFIRHAAFYFQLAPMLFWSVVSGATVAILSYRCLPVLEGIFREGEAGRDRLGPRDGATGREARDVIQEEIFDQGSARAFLASLAVLVSLFALPYLVFQSFVLAALLLITAGRGAKSLRASALDLSRAWPWFLYLAWLHLFLSDGEYLWGPVTRPGASAFLLYGIRLACLVLLGPWLAASFPRRWLAGSASPYARGLLAALPCLPALHGAAMNAGRACFRIFRGGRGKGGMARALDAGIGPHSNSKVTLASVLAKLSDGFREGLARTGQAR